MREIADSPAGDGGDLSEEQSRKFDELKGDLASLEQRIDRQRVLDEAERRMQGETITGGADDFGTECRAFSIQRAIASRIEPGAVDAGREVEISQELARRSGRASDGILVPLVAMIPNLERRVLTVAGDGSNLVQTDVLADQFIDALRPSSVAVRLGAMTITDLRGDIALPKMDALTPAAEWVAENSALTPGDHSFTQVTGSPKHLGLLTELSRKTVLQTNPAIENIIRMDFMSKLGIGVDLAVMKGTGDNGQPTGITESSPGTKDESSGAPTWADVVEVMAMVEAADVPMASLGWAMNAYSKKKFRAVAKESNEPVYLIGDDNALGGAPVAVTSQLLGNPNDSPVEDGEVLFGAWNQVIVAFWSSVEILVNPFESTAYTKGNVQVRGFIDGDVLVRHAQAFVHWQNLLVTA
jgi:HK97 family phage major capsid protein